MNILLCPDSFKGSLTSLQAAKAIEKGIRRASNNIETTMLPIGDGGEGSMEALCLSLKGHRKIEKIRVKTFDPLRRETTASYTLIDGETAYVEIAEASGLTLLRPEERDIIRADTYGTGMLIADAYGKGIRKFLIGLGGSATCDAGFGAHVALKKLHHEMNFPDSGPLLPDAEFTLLCDVDNPLCGNRGAARIFASQKGASEQEIEMLEVRNKELARKYFPFRKIDIENLPKAGAAGGLAGMLMACFNTVAVDGIDKILDLIGFDKFARNCDLIITGEGCLDKTTLSGKAPYGILQRGNRLGIPVMAFGGRVQNRNELLGAGFMEVRQATPPGTIGIPYNIQASKFLEETALITIKEYLQDNGKDTKLYN